MIGKQFTILALATGILIAGPAMAGQPESAARTIGYADLNLAKPADVKVLHRRIAAALEAVCGSYEGAGDAASAGEADAISRCRVAARTEADQRVAAIVASKSQVASR